MVVIREKVEREYFNPLAVKDMSFDQPVVDNLIDLRAWQHQELLVFAPVCDEMNPPWLMKSDKPHLSTLIESESMRNTRLALFHC